MIIGYYDEYEDSAFTRAILSLKKDQIFSLISVDDLKNETYSAILLNLSGKSSPNTYTQILEFVQSAHETPFFILTPPFFQMQFPLPAQPNVFNLSNGQGLEKFFDLMNGF